jgi:hypothetical protein
MLNRPFPPQGKTNPSVGNKFGDRITRAKLKTYLFQSISGIGISGGMKITTVCEPHVQSTQI